MNASRLIFIICIIIIILSGIIIIIITNYIKYSSKINKYKLIKLLWKFEPNEYSHIIYDEKKLSWYKLLCAGLMCDALIISFIIKIIKNELISIVLFFSIFFTWLIFINYYWHHYVIKDMNNNSSTASTSSLSVSSSSSSPSSSLSYQKKSIIQSLDESFQQSVKDNNHSDAKEEDALDKRLPLTIITGFLGQLSIS